MKTSVFFAGLMVCSLFANTIKCQEVKTPLYASLINSTQEENSTAVDTASIFSASPKEDVIINMAMIESFRRCYDKIEPFSLTEFFKGDANDISTKYMAYMRARLHPGAIDQALAEEMTTVQTSMNQKPQVSIATISYNERPTVQVPVAVVQEKAPIVVSSAKSEVKTGKRINGVKWIMPKNNK